LSTADALIHALGLEPHPEGGWYRETWRSEAPAGERGAATAILFLLEQGQCSHWHKVDATELWLFHSGSPLLLRTAASDSGPVRETRLGADVLAGDQPQVRAVVRRAAAQGSTLPALVAGIVSSNAFRNQAAPSDPRAGSSVARN
jgi:hypothetical protein